MSYSERELEPYGEQFIVGLDAIARALNLYPAEHPHVAAQCQRFIESLNSLRGLTGQAVFSMVNAELFVNGVALKRLSLTHHKSVTAWGQRGIGQIAFDPEVTPAALLALNGVLSATWDELKARGGVAKALSEGGAVGIRAGRVAVGLEADRVSMVDGDLAGPPEPDSADHDLAQARERYQESFQRLLVALQGAAEVDPRIDMVRNMGQQIASRLLERRAVRDLAARLRDHHKETYRHALSGAVMSVLMGAAMGINAGRLRMLGEAALLRDIGKLQIAPEVLDQRGADPASTAEYERHPALGARLLLGQREIDPSAAIVAHEHHARFDRKGFPTLTARSMLHGFARLVAVASDYDRLTGGYPGVASTSVWEAVAEIIRGVGSRYDPGAVRALLQITGCMPEGTPVKLVDGREGIVTARGRQSWLCPEVAVLRDSQGQELPPAIVATDGIAEAGESSVYDTIAFAERDFDRLEALRDAG